MPEQKQKPKAHKFLKAATFILLGCTLLFGNFLLERHLAARGEVQERIGFTTFDLKEDNLIPQHGIVRFDEAKSNDATVVSADSDRGEYVFELREGHLWGYFGMSDAKVDFVLGNVVVMPDRASFELDFDGKDIVLKSFEGDVFLGFLAQGVTLENYLNEYSEVFMNRLLVPRGTKVTIPLSKVDQRLKTLLYSKLIKEFAYQSLTEQEKNGEWVAENNKKDATYSELVKQEFQGALIRQGVVTDENTLSKGIELVEDKLIFVPAKKERKSLDRLFAYLDDAIFYAGQSNAAEAEVKLREYELYLEDLPLSLKENDYYRGKIGEYLDGLSIFGPGDPLYTVYTGLLDRQFNANQGRYDIVNRFWNDVYKAMDVSIVDAEQALDRYYRYLKVTLGKYEDEVYYKNYLAYQNQLFDNLFFLYSDFYQDRYFEMKDAVEGELLKLYSSDKQLSQELAQTFINNKISYLRTIMKLFFADQINVGDSRAIVSRLVREINELMPEDTSQVAVLELFETRLEEISSFWGYLNSPEYYSSAAYGSDNEERYQSYLKERDRIWSLIDLQVDIFGDAGAIVEISVEDVRAEIQTIFAKNPDVGGLQIGEIKDVSQRYVDVSAVIGGYPFEALYDRDYQTLKNIYVYGELISDRQVKLSGLFSLLEKHFAENELPVELTDNMSEETNAQRIFRRYLAGEIEKVGFKVEESNITRVDEAGSRYQVSEVYLEEYRNALVSFEFVVQGEKVVKLVIAVDGREIIVEGEYSLDELEDLVTKKSDPNQPVGR